MRSRTVRRWWIVAVAATALVAPVTPAGAAEVDSRPERSAGFNDDVYDVAYHDGAVFVVGRFTEAYDDGGTVGRSRVAAVSADSGSLLDWAPDADGAVQAIAVHDDSVYIAGDFTRVDGERRAGLAKLDADTGELDADFAPTVEGRVMALAVGHDRLYVAGALSSVNGTSRDNAAAVSLGSGSLDDRWTPETDRMVHDIEVSASRIYLAGVFSELNGSSSDRKLAAVDPETGETDEDFDPDLSMRVRDIVRGPDGLYAAAGGTGGRVISLRDDGSVRWAVRGNGDVQAVAVVDDVVYLGGHFNGLCRTSRTDPEYSCPDDYATRRKFAALDLDGDLLDWAPQANSAVGVHALATDEEESALAAGGEFTSFDDGAVSQPHFALFQ
ncbi:MAG: hypothetical protein ACRDTU_23340 [Micromonosporaceae bacterium]